MKIGVISDSHDHLPNLRYALTQLGQRGVKTVIHCGDMIAPFVSLELARFEGRVHTVFGNNDGDRFLTERVTRSQTDSVTHHGEIGTVELDGQTVAFAHYQAQAVGHALAAGCQVALFGHTHQFHQERQGELLVLNPGELLGMKGAPSFCIYDTATRQVERCAFAQQPWPAQPWQ